MSKNRRTQYGDRLNGTLNWEFEYDRLDCLDKTVVNGTETRYQYDPVETGSARAQPRSTRIAVRASAAERTTARECGIRKIARGGGSDQQGDGTTSDGTDAKPEQHGKGNEDGSIIQYSNNERDQLVAANDLAFLY